MLFTSVKIGCFEGVKVVLENNELIKELNLDINQMLHPINNETLLFQVVHYGLDSGVDVDIARYLLSKGADYNLENNHARKATDNITTEELNNSINAVIDLTCSYHDGEIVKQSGYKKAESAYGEACNLKKTGMIKLFSSHALFNSIRNNNIEAMNSALKTAEEYLGQASKILDEYDFNLQTALHLAALNPDSSYMERLLATLADNDPRLEMKNANGKTALHLAAEERNEKVVSLLLNKGASILVKDDMDQIPLHKAVESYENDSSFEGDIKFEDNIPSLNIIRELVLKHAKNGEEINTKDKEGLSPLDIALEIKDNDLALSMNALHAKNSRAKPSTILSHRVKSSSMGWFSAENSQVKNVCSPSQDKNALENEDIISNTNTM